MEGFYLYAFGFTVIAGFAYFMTRKREGSQRTRLQVSLDLLANARRNRSGDSGRKKRTPNSK